MSCRAISLYIYKNKAGDCSNGGISNKYNEVIIEHPEGNIILEENNLPENFVIVDEIVLGDFVHYFLRPADGNPLHKNHNQWQYGGTICYSSDSRWREIFPYPLCLHDRHE